jgi:hypothetical protein
MQQRLHGIRLKGIFAIFRTHPAESGFQTEVFFMHSRLSLSPDTCTVFAYEAWALSSELQLGLSIL